MRLGFGLVALLLVMAVVLLLSSSHTKRTLDAVRVGVPSLREDVPARPWDTAAAQRLLERLESLVDDPAPPRDELADAAAAAAGWVAGTTTGSHEQHVAVKLRSAADELALAGADPGDRHRIAARRHLEEARGVLAGAPPREAPAIRGIRDQLENLQNTRREQSRELEQP